MIILHIKLHEEVIKFLTETGTVFNYHDGTHGFQVNNTLYRSVLEKGYYTVQYIEQIIKESEQESYEH